MLASHYLFETALKKCVGDISAELAQEVVKRPDDFAEAEQTGTMRNVFDSFPRRSAQYCSVVSTLADLAGYAARDILKFLAHTCAVVFSGKKCSVFAELAAIDFPEPVRSGPVKTQYVKFFELIFISDLVCIILARHGLPENLSFLVQCGLMICASQPSDAGTISLVLEQWSVVFSMISLTKPAVLLEMLPQFIINKPDMFFAIMKFVRLDALECPADDLLDIMEMHVKRAKQRKTVSSVMLSSLASFLMTYQGSPERLNEFMETALKYCWDVNVGPGALDLVVSLIPRMQWSKEKAMEFYEKVFPMAQTEKGITTAAKALRSLMCGTRMRAEWLFWVWGPEARENEFEFLEWAGDDDYISIFVKYFLHSSYYRVCPNLLKDIIVHLASIDFDEFLERLLPAFVGGIEKNTDRFMCFISIVPMINDPKFLKIPRTKTLTAEKIQKFNESLGSTAASVLARETGLIRKFDFTSDQLETHRQEMSQATVFVGKTLENWEVYAGIPVETIVNKGSGPCASPSNQSLKIMKIMPFLLSSELFQRPELMDSVIILAASADSSMSQPAYRLAQTNLKRPEHQRHIMQQLVNMIDLCNKQAIALVCLQLIVEGLKDMEPTTPDNEDEFEYSIEFAGFLALTNEHPLIRIVGFELLKKANLLLKNRGFYSQIETNTQAIESNAKHNMLMHKLPKHPGNYGYYDDDLDIQSVLKSTYQIPWLYFLAEFGHILLATNYRPILTRIIGLARSFADDPALSRHARSCRQGLFVVFFSTCYIEGNLDKSAFGYTNNAMFSADAPDSYSEVLKSIIARESGRKDLLVAIRHVHYTLVRMVIECYPFKESSLETSLSVLFDLLKAVEGNKQIKRQIFSSVLDLILPMLEQFSAMELNLACGKFCPKCRFSRLSRDSEQLILVFLSVILMWLEKRKGANWFVSPPLVFFILNWASMKVSSERERIQTYARVSLVSLLEICSCCVPGTPQDRELNAKILLACAKIESRGFKVLKPLLLNNIESLLEEALTMCITQKSSIAGLFFDAIYKLLPALEKKAEVNELKHTTILPMRLIGKFFLVGLVGLKTGSALAKHFLLTFMSFYATSIDCKTKEALEMELSTQDIVDLLPKHFVGVTEFVVAVALDCLKDPKFRGTVTVIVEIMKRCIKHLQMVPHQYLCNCTELSITTDQFLETLGSLTSAKANTHDFDRMVDLWALLLEKPEHHDFVLSFLGRIPCDTENEFNVNTAVALFSLLMDRHPSLIIERVTQRCSFEFYAHVVFETKSPFDREFWIVPVLSRAVNYHKESVMPHIFKIVQFALLFHVNQTQTLLKRVSKSLSVPYRRNTLNSCMIVRVFQEHIEMESNRELINKWALEAMKWVIGSRDLKLSHTSLLILNNLNYEISDADVTDLLMGICKSTSYFLKQWSPGSQLENDFINETFKVFDRHFVGHEQISLNYINSFIEFVVSVDVYFRNMLLLYSKCLRSDVTRSQALNSMVDALRPSLNELEVDSQARKTLKRFLDVYHMEDLQLVWQVLSKTNEGDDKLDISSISPIDMSHALSHYARMVETASVDLKRRILKVSTLIVRNFTSTKNEELDKQALRLIFRAATQLLPGSKEALDFVLAVAENDPLIPNTPLVENLDWNVAVDKAIANLPSVA